MDCRAVEKQLSAAGPRSPELERHLESCGACRRFAGDLVWITGQIDSAMSTPGVLRERTLDACRSELVRRIDGRPQPFARRLRTLWESPRFATAAAGLAVVLLVVSVVLHVTGAPDSDSSRVVAVSILQIFVQNFVAALLLPALLVFRHRAGVRSRTAAQSGE